MKEFVVYTGLRIALFVATFGVIFGIWGVVAESVPIFWCVVIAFIVSGLGSYALLQRPRAAFAQRVEARASKASAAFEQRRAKEDVE